MNCIDISIYSKGFLSRLYEPNYHPSLREFFDDFIYRQSLELLGFKDSWTMEITAARELLLAQKNPIVPLVVKQNMLRISSLLAMAFPQDPIIKIYISSGWITPMPVAEWREFNNDFNVLEHYREVQGLMAMTKKFGAFNHDTLMSQLSGIEEPMIRELRQRSFQQIKNKSAPTLFRYFIGNPKTVNRKSYQQISRAYGSHAVGFLPFYEHGTFPLSIPGESVVMHRNQFHRLNVMGKYNAGLINGFIMQTLENKYVEMRFWSDFTKEGIPTTNLLSELGVPSFSNLSTAATLRKVQESVNIFNQKFPQGWVLKGLFDLGTENDILSDKTDFVAAVGTYLKSDFETYKKSVNEKYQDLKVAPEYALTSLKEHQGYKGWKILQLLANTKSVMIQERFHIVKEFRVEVVAGQVLGGKSTIDRYGYAFKKNGRWDSSYQHPTKEQIQAAEEYAQKLMNALPSELRGMTFGLDVAITNEGKAVLIESNPGGNSNFLYEEEPASTKELTRFLLKFPSLVKSGKISPGLSPRAQMHFIKRKFAEWAIDSATLYPGMSFLEDRIEDPEFKRLPPVSRESNRQAKHSIPFEVGRCKASLQN